MQRYAIRFDREAANDLAAIRDHIASVRDKDFANNFAGQVIDYCERLAVLPHRGAHREAIWPGLRTLSWRRTITIAFQVNDGAEEVVILGVFYRGRDYLAALSQRFG